MPLILDTTHPPPGVSVLATALAVRQEIRPLRIRLLDLGGSGGEVQAMLLALLSDTPLQVEALFGDNQPFDAVVAWSDDPAAADRTPIPAAAATLLVGEAARADLERRHGLAVEHLTRPVTELVNHSLNGAGHPLIVGQEPTVEVPVARSWRIGLDSLARIPGIEVLAHAPRSGVHLAYEAPLRRLYVLNQIAWSPLGFARRRRQLAGADTTHHEGLPAFGWRAHAHLLIRAWLNHAVYQPLSLPTVPE